MSLIRTNDVIASQNDNFRFVKVRFKHESGAFSAKEYHYKTLDSTIAAGDEVVVDSPTNGFVIVVVTEVLEYYEVEEQGYNYKWIVQKVDVSAYEELKAKEKAVQKQLAKVNMKARLDNSLSKAAEELGEDNVNSLKALARL